MRGHKALSFEIVKIHYFVSSTKSCKIMSHLTLEQRYVIEAYLKIEKSKDFIAEQIVGYCNTNNLAMVSIERIYQHIRRDKENGGDLYKFTRHRLKHRKRPVGKHYPIANRVSIEERPQVVENKERFGDWEMDTIIGSYQQGAILTLTERMTNFIFIKRLPKGKDAKELAKTLVNHLIPYKDFIHTIKSRYLFIYGCDNCLIIGKYIHIYIYTYIH